MGSKEVVAELAISQGARFGFSVVKNLCSNCVVHLEDLRELADRMAKDEERFTTEQIDFWNLVEIRAGSILESLNSLDKTLKGEDE